MSGKKDIGRRNVLKIAGGSVVGLAGLSSTSLAASDDETVGMREAGIVDEYRKLRDQYKFEEARQLLAEHDVEFTTRFYNKDSSGEVSTQDYYGKGQSSASFDTYLMDSETQEYALVMTWDLRNVQVDPDLPQPKDKAALGYRPDGFIYQDDSLEHSGRLRITDQNKMIEGVTSVVKEPPIDTNSGAVVSFDDRYHDLAAEGDGFMQIRIKRDEDGTGSGGVGGVFSHAWSLAGIGGTPGNQSISLSAGAISVSTDFGVDNWELPGQDERDETL